MTVVLHADVLQYQSETNETRSKPEGEKRSARAIGVQGLKQFTHRPVRVFIRMHYPYQKCRCMLFLDSNPREGKSMESICD